MLLSLESAQNAPPSCSYQGPQAARRLLGHRCSFSDEWLNQVSEIQNLTYAKSVTGYLFTSIGLVYIVHSVMYSPFQETLLL